jgi:hypothetical protein
VGFLKEPQQYPPIVNNIHLTPTSTVLLEIWGDIQEVIDSKVVIQQLSQLLDMQFQWQDTKQLDINQQCPLLVIHPQWFQQLVTNHHLP